MKKAEFFGGAIVACMIVFGCVFLVSLLFVIFVAIPVSLYTQAECLRAGYPKYAVTIGLERYCMTLDGAITVRVKKQ